MKTYKNINVLLRDLQKEINHSLNDVAKDVKKVMKQKIEKEVYSVYTPTLYVRQMDDGGLTDDTNIHHEVTNNGTLIVENIRHDGNRNVAEIVETGNDYLYNFQYAGVPRPFTEATRKTLVSEDIPRKSLKKSLQNKGYAIK